VDGPQISSQVLIANAYIPITTKAATGSRLACNFGFLDTWSSPGKTSIERPTKNTKYSQGYLTDVIKREEPICRLATARVIREEHTKPLRLKTISTFSNALRQ